MNTVHVLCVLYLTWYSTFPVASTTSPTLLIEKLNNGAYNMTCFAQGEEVSNRILVWVSNQVTEQDKYDNLEIIHPGRVLRLRNPEENINQEFNRKSSIHYPLPPILDWRWKDLKTQTGLCNEKPHTLIPEAKNVSYLQLSLRFHSKAEFQMTVNSELLCAEMNETVSSVQFSSNCVSPNNTCRELDVVTPWRHYNIYTWKDKYFVCSNCSDVYNYKLIKHFNLHNLTVMSDYSIQWKIHNYDIVHADVLNSKIKESIGKGKNNCTILFYYLCSTCKIHFTNPEILDVSGTNRNWMSINIHSNSFTYILNNNKSKHSFVIFDPRPCNEIAPSNLAIINSNTTNLHQSCQLISNSTIATYSEPKYSNDSSCSKLINITNCDTHVICNDNRNCRCSQGFSGKFCETKIDNNLRIKSRIRVSCNGCFNNICDEYQRCIGGCKANFVGEYCESCAKGKWGHNCMSPCSNGCEGNICVRHNGQCRSCKYGYFGLKCDECAAGKWGENCTENCFEGCHGNKCTPHNGQCDNCKWGKWGNNCTKTCNTGCKDNTCDFSDGKCTCKEGYAGEKCGKCKPGKWGDNCQETCFEGCQGDKCHRNGQCESCKAGYDGSKCDRCKDAKWDKNCTQSCSIGCKDNTCSFLEAKCTCKDGYVGDKCDQCKMGKWGQDCSMICGDGCIDKQCNHKTGECQCDSIHEGKFCKDYITFGEKPLILENSTGHILFEYPKQLQGDQRAKFEIWINGNWIEGENNISNVQFNGLSPDNSYKIRVSICVKQKCIPKALEFNATTCADRNFEFVRKESSILLTSHEDNKHMNCKFDNYSIYINGTEFKNISTEEYTIDHLSANTESKIEIKSKNRVILSEIVSTSDTSTETKSAKLYFMLLFLIPIVMLPGFLIYRNKVKNGTISGAESVMLMEETPVCSLDINNQLNIVLKRSELSLYLKDLTCNEGTECLDAEYEAIKLSKGNQLKTDVAKLEMNKVKNRFNNVLPNDSYRVILNSTEDYINASFIEGYRGPKTYIAAQCPKLITANDFWHMIWQENVSIIVMLAALSEDRQKVTQYWPNEYESITYRHFDVLQTSAKHHTDFIVRNFTITNGSDTRKLRQFYFPTWPDNGIPLFPLSLLDFIKCVRAHDAEEGPVVVHCSAGVGRTGVYIMCDHYLRTREDLINIPGHLKSIRNCRANLVSNAMQYKLIYYILNEIINGNDSKNLTLEVVKILNEHLIKGYVSADMQYISDRSFTNKILYLMSQNRNYVLKKNRTSQTAPRGECIIYLPIYSKDESSKYINAVYMNSYEHKNGFISTQLPLANTIRDFWRLVDEKDIKLIIVLQNVYSDDSSVFKFWPSYKVMEPVDYLKISLDNTCDENSYIVYNIKVEHSKKSKASEVTLVEFKSWQCGEIVPNDIEAFYHFFRFTSKIATYSPTLLCCYDGAVGCGLYATFNLVFNKIMNDNVFNICWAVRSIKRFREEFMIKAEQYHFLYDLSIYYMNEHMKDDHAYENSVQDNTEQLYENIFNINFEFKEIL